MLRSCGYTNVRDHQNHDNDRLVCGFCGREEEQLSLRRCTGCKKSAYCSKDCQTKDWNNHKRRCKVVLDSKKKPRDDNSKKKTNKATFKRFGVTETIPTSSSQDVASFKSPTPETRGAIWGVVHPGLFGVIPERYDDPLEYHLLANFIHDFVDNKTVFTLLSNPEIGELVISKCEDQDVYARAVVVAVRDIVRGESVGGGNIPSTDFLATSDDSDDSADKTTIDLESARDEGPICVVDLWFVDLGCLQTETPSKDLIPIADFWDELERMRTLPHNESLRVKHFVDLPARLVPCCLHTTDPETGEYNRRYGETVTLYPLSK